MTPEEIVKLLRGHGMFLLPSEREEAADLIERQAKALEEAREDQEALTQIKVLWEKRAEAAEAKCERQAKALETARNNALEEAINACNAQPLCPPYTPKAMQRLCVDAIRALKGE